MGYVKLFGSILDSTVWKLAPPQKVVWITLMAMADRDGVVEASVPGLADRAHVSRRHVEKALALFLAPDPDSRTELYEGRRIEKIDGGWRLLNHAKYREMQSADDRRAKTAARVRRHREQLANRPAAAAPPAPAAAQPDVTLSVTQSNASNVIRSDPDQKQIGRGGAPPPWPGIPDAAPVSGARWTGLQWLQAYGQAWSIAKGRLAYGRGSVADSRACRDLDDMLGSLPEEAEALATQAAAPAMFKIFLADDGQARENEHPWSWFVGRFNTLRAKVAKPGGDRGGGFRPSDYPETA